MKMRQHKKCILGRIFVNNWAWSQLRIYGEVSSPLGDLVQHKLNLQLLVEDLPDMAPEYQCIRVKDGIVVDTFQTRSEALGLVLKHSKQRKAKLQVLNTDTGELELFSEEEMA